MKSITISGVEYKRPNTRTTMADVKLLAEALQLSLDGKKDEIKERIFEEMDKLASEEGPAGLEVIVEVLEDELAVERTSAPDYSVEYNDKTKQFTVYYLEGNYIQEPLIVTTSPEKVIQCLDEQGIRPEDYFTAPNKSKKFSLDDAMVAAVSELASTEELINNEQMNKSDRIRVMLAQGLEKRIIARVLGYRYQMVYQVEQRWLEAQALEAEVTEDGDQ